MRPCKRSSIASETAETSKETRPLRHGCLGQLLQMAAYLPAMFHMANTEIVSQARKFLHVNIPRFLAVNDYDGDEFRASRRLSAGGMHNDDLLGDYMCTICTVCHTITARVRRPHGIRSARSPLPPEMSMGNPLWILGMVQCGNVPRRWHLVSLRSGRTRKQLGSNRPLLYWSPGHFQPNPLYGIVPNHD